MKTPMHKYSSCILLFRLIEKIIKNKLFDNYTIVDYVRRINKISIIKIHKKAVLRNNIRLFLQKINLNEV